MRKQYIPLQIMKTDHALIKRLAAIRQNNMVDLVHYMLLKELFQQPPAALANIQDRLRPELTHLVETQYPEVSPEIQQKYVEKLFAEKMDFYVNQWVNGEL